MPDFAPELVLDPLVANAPRILRYDPDAYFPEWRSAAARTLRQLLGLNPAKVDPNLRITAELACPTHTQLDFLFAAEPHADVPCSLLLPKGVAKPPVVICLQGHSSGAHISLGQPKYPGDDVSIAGDRDFARQALHQGYAALVLEQRCFGERKDQRPSDRRPEKPNCHHATMTSLLLGRTMIGQRVWDVSRAIDLLPQFPVDPARIACMGNSGGGTVTYYAAATDDRIALAMPSCAVCTFQHSIAALDHCPDNYIPGILHYFEMADLAGLIAPRPLVLVAGQRDPIFPLPGVLQAYADIQAIYQWAGAPGRTALVLGPEGHRFYAAQAWPKFRELSDW